MSPRVVSVAITELPDEPPPPKSPPPPPASCYCPPTPTVFAAHLQRRPAPCRMMSSWSPKPASVCSIGIVGAGEPPLPRLRDELIDEDRKEDSEDDHWYPVGLGVVGLRAVVPRSVRHFCGIAEQHRRGYSTPASMPPGKSPRRKPGRIVFWTMVLDSVLVMIRLEPVQKKCELVLVRRDDPRMPLSVPFCECPRH